MCLPTGAACRQADTTGLTCATAGQFCCVVACPELAQPAPNFCDGGPYAPLYDAKACIVGFACTPVACTTAGGTCVGIAPGSCPNNNFGDATKYSCGGGIGSGCCLPLEFASRNDNNRRTAWTIPTRGRETRGQSGGMKHFFSSFALSLGLVLPVLAACGGSTVDAPGSSGDGTATGASGSEPVDVGRLRT